LEPTKTFLAEIQVAWKRRRRILRRPAQEQRQAAPREEYRHHDRGELHDPEGFGARLVQPFDVRPPEIYRDEGGKEDRELFRRNPEGEMQKLADFIDETPEIWPGADAADRPCQDVIEQERRDGQASHKRTHRIAYDDVNAAANEHAAALHVDGTHS